jgi:hypothetical protein
MATTGKSSDPNTLGGIGVDAQKTIAQERIDHKVTQYAQQHLDVSELRWVYDPTVRRQLDEPNPLYDIFSYLY